MDAFTTDSSDFDLQRSTAPPAARSADTRKADIDAPNRKRTRFLASDPVQTSNCIDSKLQSGHQQFENDAQLLKGFGSPYNDGSGVFANHLIQINLGRHRDDFCCFVLKRQDPMMKTCNGLPRSDDFEETPAITL